MLSKRIKQLRSQNKITQSELANNIGVAKTTLAAYEQAKSEPNIHTLIKIADYFDVTVDYLIGRSEGRLLEDQEIYDRFGLDDPAILGLEHIKRISGNNEYTKGLMKTVNLLLDDFTTLVAINDYLNAKVSEDQYVICKYYIAQNGSDLIEEPDATEKVLNANQWANVFFAEIQRNLDRLKNTL